MNQPDNINMDPSVQFLAKILVLFWAKTFVSSINSEKGVARVNFVAAVNKNRIQWETTSSSKWLITTMTQTDIINYYKL